MNKPNYHMYSVGIPGLGLEVVGLTQAEHELQQSDPEGDDDFEVTYIGEYVCQPSQ